MPLGPLSFVTRVARTAASVIRLGVRTLGATTAAIGRALESAGTRIEARELRAIAEAERQLARESREILGRPTNEVLDPRGIPEAITRQRRQYAWRTRTVFIDRRTGQQVERFVTVSTDDLLSADEALEESASMLEREYGIDRSRFVSSEVVEVTKAAPGRRL